jgi:hypothetical protein
MKNTFWFITVSAAGFLLSGCASFKINLDKNGLKDIASAFEQSTAQSQSIYFEQFLDSFSIPVKSDVLADSIVVEPFNRWKPRSSASGGPVVGELLSFTSPLPRKDDWDKSGYFYYFHRKDQTSNRAIIFAPGFGVSDFAFNFIRAFFEMELSSGWSV